jgi:uncharacterized membrane protein
MGLLYIAAGLYHFIHPETYLRIMPPWLPAHHFLVLLSGIIEVVLGVLVIPPFTRRPAAWGLIVLLLAVFPANVQMMLNYRRDGNPLLWVAILRLPLQAALIWWAYVYTKPRKTKAI